MTVKQLKNMFEDFNDDDIINFSIDSSALEFLADDYRYSPCLCYPYKENDGTLICNVSYEYTR